MGASTESEITLNRDFFDPMVDPQLFTAAIQLRNFGDIAREDIQNYARKAGIVEKDRTNEEINEQVDDEDPTDTQPIAIPSAANEQ